MYVTCVEMIAITITISITLVIVLRQMRFKFPVILLTLLIVADISSLITSWASNAENNKEYHEEHKILLTQLIGWSTFGFNFGTNCMHWLFSFKYWVIAKEMPKLWKDGRQSSINEKLYSAFNFIGVVLNFIPCLLFAICSAKLSFQSANH